MQCEEFRGQVELLVLNEVSDVTRAQALRHLEQCAACRCEHEALCALVDDVKRTEPRAHLSASSAKTLGIHLRRALEQAHWSRRHITASRIFAVAAGLLLAVCAVWFAIWTADRYSRLEPVAHVGATQQEQRMPGFVWKLAGTKAEAAAFSYAPAVAGGMAYALRSTAEGDVVAAVRLQDGRQVWESSTQVRGYLAADTKRVYAVSNAPSAAGALVALKASSGEQAWSFSPRFAGQTSTPKVVADRVLWVGGGTLYALDAATGARIWEHHVRQGTLGSQPVVILDRVFIAADGAAWCIDIRDGSRVWHSVLDEKQSSLLAPHLAFCGNRLFVADAGGGLDGTVSCIDAVSGARLWHREGLTARHMMACEGMVFLRADSIVALDAATGTTAWQHDAGGCSPLFCTHGHLVYADASRPNALTVVQTATGRTTLEMPLGNSCTGFTMTGEVGLVNTNDGVLHAVKADVLIGHDARL